MKLRKSILLVAVLSLAFGTAVFANSKGFTIEFNRNTVNDSVQADGDFYFNVRTMANSMHYLYEVDRQSKRVSIFKPNVHLLTINPATNEAFNVVSKGRTKFLVFAQVDNLNADISALKITIDDPYKEETVVHSRTSSDPDFPSRSEFNTSTEVVYDFNSGAGTYTLKYWMQLRGQSSMQVVAEKAIFRR